MRGSEPAFWRRVGIACIATVLGATLLPAATGATKAPARPQYVASYSVTSIVTFTTQPDQSLPASTAAVSGRRTVIKRMIVRDSTHYRVDVQTVAPGIDSGTLSITLAGRRIEAYDSRTGLAAWNIVSDRNPPRPPDVQIGMGLAPMAPIPVPGQSFQQYVAMLRQPASVLHPGVRIVGHTRMLGHPVAILDYGPLIGIGQSICPPSTRQTPHPKCYSMGGSGIGRLWVATDRPALLRYAEGHFTGLPAGMMRRNYLYRVTSLRFGPIPLAATRYTPPVPARRSTWLEAAVIGGGDSGWFAGWPELWRTGILYRAPPPLDSHGHRYTENGVLIRRDTLIPIPSAMGVLYYRPTPSAFPGMPPSQYRGSGPYVYIQERIQVHGLPAALRHGRLLQRGRCRLWAGSYRKRLVWVALARGTLALLVTTNSLGEGDLTRYASRSLC